MTDLASIGLRFRILTTLMGKVNRAVGETLHLAEDVRVELDYLAALDDGRYRCVVMLVLVLNVFSYIPYIHVFKCITMRCG
jgi:hypothetical protein